MSRSPTADLVQKAAEGNRDAFEKLFQLYYAAVFAGCLARLRRHADAQDAAQETFIEAWRMLPRLRDYEKFPGWLRRITVGRCGRILRRPGPEREWDEMADLLPGAEPAPADLSVRNETEALFTRCMSALTKPERETLLLFLGGRSHQQIAEFLGVPVGTVKRRIHDARDRLQKAMNGSLESAIGRKTKSGQATVDRALNIRKAGSRMAALLKAVSSATLDAVSELYRTCDWIHIANGQINREPVDLDAYEAIVARVKINTNLLGDRFVPGATAQVCLIFKGVERVFDAKVTSDSGIVLTLQKK